MTRKAIAFCILLLVSIWLATGCASNLATPGSTPTPIVFQGTPEIISRDQPAPVPTSTPIIPQVPPEIISHDMPNLTANVEILGKAGCTQSKSDPSRWDCTSNKAIAGLGCDEIVAEDLLAGLTPAYPVMRCQRSAYLGDPPNKKRFRRIGCMLARYTSYILFKNDEYQLITKESELQATFAPIESVDEALSYALVATDMRAMYGLRASARFQSICCLVSKIEDTHVEHTPNGFLVHLFNSPPSCNTVSLSAVDVLVTHDGQVRQVNSELIYEYIAIVD